jgi:hypothetical protein
MLSCPVSSEQLNRTLRSGKLLFRFWGSKVIILALWRAAFGFKACFCKMERLEVCQELD